MIPKRLWALAASIMTAVAVAAMAVSPAAAQSPSAAQPPVVCALAINPEGLSTLFGVDVCIDRGDGAFYFEGETIHICVAVRLAQIQVFPPPPAPLLRLTNSVNGGPSRLLLEDFIASGQRCIAAVIQGPFGSEIVRADLITADGTIIGTDSASFTSAPRRAGASITVDRGPGGAYGVGDTITYCYTVPGPGPIRILDLLPDGRTQVLHDYVDDGRGDCFRATVAPPLGQECLRLEYFDGGRWITDQVCFQVVVF